MFKRKKNYNLKNVNFLNCLNDLKFYSIYIQVVMLFINKHFIMSVIIALLSS